MISQSELELKIVQGIDNKTLGDKLIELLNRGNIPLAQLEINEILDFDLAALKPPEKDILREYVRYFTTRSLSQEEIDQLISKIEMSMRPPPDSHF